MPILDADILRLLRAPECAVDTVSPDVGIELVTVKFIMPDERVSVELMMRIERRHHRRTCGTRGGNSCDEGVSIRRDSIRDDGIIGCNGSRNWGSRTNLNPSPPTTRAAMPLPPLPVLRGAPGRGWGEGDFEYSCGTAALGCGSGFTAEGGCATRDHPHSTPLPEYLEKGPEGHFTTNKSCRPKRN